MHSDWLWQFLKEMDFVITVFTQWEEWPAEMHEGFLLMGFSLPLLKCYPCPWAQSPAMVAFAHTVLAGSKLITTLE
jgi:hypothetical protein